MSRVAIIGALPESLLNFRAYLLRSLVSRGHEVTAMAAKADPEIVFRLARMGVNFRAYPVRRRSANPIFEVATYFALRRLLQELQPNVILTYTIKPNIWGALAASPLSGVRVFAMIEGLGYAFQRYGIRRVFFPIIAHLYKAASHRAEKVFFLNKDNIKEFVDRKIINLDKAALIPGIGVPLDEFMPHPLPQEGFTFLVISRLLKEKGLYEYAEAAQIVKRKYQNVKFQIVGPTDPSRDAVPLSIVKSWENLGLVEYLGETKDVRPFISACHVYVLPSFHEGMPRTILEAMAMGRPILTTNAPGCRETVVPGENGHLVPKGSAKALAEKMIWFIENRDQLSRMGNRSRHMAEELFDVHKINAQLIEIMGL